MLKQHDYVPENEGSVWTENRGVSLLRKKGVSLDRRSGVSFTGISSNGLINYFSDAFNAISIEDCNATLYRNHFNNIYNYNSYYHASNYGSAISIKNSINASSLTVTVGGNSSNEPNIFVNTNIGVLINNESPNSSFYIIKNDFNNTSYDKGNTTNFQNTAISVNQPLSISGPFVTITENTILNNRIGIHAANVPNILIGTDVMHDQLPNKISFNLGSSPSMSFDYSGIWIKACNDAFVWGGSDALNPDIKNDQEITTSGISYFRGMDIENSTGCMINCNVIKNIPRSIYFTGDCNLSKLRLNRFENYENAIELNDDQTVLPPQGDNPGTGYTPYDNKWVDGTNSIYRTFRNSANPSPFDWYYDVTNADPSLIPLPTNTVIATDRPDNCNCYCNSSSRITDRDNSMGKIISDSIPFSTNASEFSYQAKMNLFLAFKADSTLLYQGSTNDSIYLNFFNTMKNSNMNQLDISVKQTPSFRFKLTPPFQHSFFA